MKMQRSAGILLPVSSLPSPYGIGCFSQEAYDFVDWLKEAGQTYWQILPLGVTSYGDSPYQSFSAFAGNPYFISLDELVKEGVLTAEECKKAKFGRKADDIDYSQLYKERGRLLRLAYSRSDIGHNAAFAAFCEKNKWWLDDFALFMAVKGRFEGKPWIEWAEDIRLRWQNAMDYYRRELYFEVEYYKYLQFKFDQQWRALKAYANEKGIRIIGDIPIYVALDSADAWANPQMFQLDEDNIPTAVAGVPPDGFSPTGQLWGNPLYRWEKHRETGYQWWITRLWYCFELYDVVRIDHFRGFDEYFSIPYGSETAAPGHWEKGPGIELFRAVEQALGKREIIAEDLGYMSETVRQLVLDSGFPGMKVLEFAFDSRDTGSASDYLPHNYPVNSVAYTGTHDNETLVSWYQTITSAERTLVRDYLYDYTTPETQLYKSMIALIFRSAAAVSVLQPMFLKPTYDELYNHFKTIAESVPETPMLLYNNPGRVGYTLSAKLVEELAHNVPNIIGMKDTSGDITQTSEFIRRTRDVDFKVFGGKDTLLYASLCHGAVGGVCTAANFMPELITDVYNKYAAGDLAGSLEAQFKLNPVRLSMDAASFPVAAKDMANLRGNDVGVPYLPTLPTPEGPAKQGFIKAMTEAGLL